MALPIPISYVPMDALLTDEIPQGPQCQYEPRWTVFAAWLFEIPKRLHVNPRADQPLSRYFKARLDFFLNYKLHVISGTNFAR